MLNNFNLRSSINVDSFHLSLFISSIAKSYKFTNRTFRNDPSQLPLVAPFHSFIWFIRSFILRMNHLIHTHVRIVAKFEKAFSIRQTIIDDHSFTSLSLSLSLSFSSLASSPLPPLPSLHEWQTRISLAMCITYRSTVTTRISLLSLLSISLFLTLLLAYLSFLRILSLTFRLHGDITDFLPFSLSFLHSPFQSPHLGQILFCPLLQTIYLHISSTFLFHSTYSIP